jgi:hypothetical protein
VGRRVDAVDDEQGQKGEEPEAFNDTLTRILQAFDPNMSVGTNSGLYDTTASKPKYTSVVSSGAVQQAVESTDASSLGKDPLDPYFKADLAAAVAAGRSNISGRMHLTFDPVQFPGDSTHTVSANDSLAGQFFMPEYSLNKTKLAALAADGWARVGIRFERLYRTEHFSGSTTTISSAVSGQGSNRFVI